MEFILAIFFGALGAIIASFAGVVAERIYTGESWTKDRSRCNSCGRTLGALDLVPVLSWVFSGGKCTPCGARVSGLYALSELALGAVFVLAYLTLGLTLLLPLFLIAVSLLAFIVLYDLRHTIVPQVASNLLILVSLGYAYLAASDMRSFGLTLLVAGTIGFGFFLMHALSRGRAMGLGDSPIALALSLLVGSAAIPGLLFSFWIGALCAVFILVRYPKGHRMGIEVPFVPFLAAGYLLAFFTQWNPLHIVL